MSGPGTPLAIDLFCGLGGWTEGLLAEGYNVVGFDIERHVYGEKHYPAQLVLQDVLTLDGAQFRNAALIVASPPCQAYSYRAMPWKKAKALPPPNNELFEACFRIQREACEAAGRFIPLVVENVRGAQPWVGRAKWNYGSFYLWGDVPALMPCGCPRKNPRGCNLHIFEKTGQPSPTFTTMSANPGLRASGWFGPYTPGRNDSRNLSSKSLKRKEWSAEIAKIPFELSTWIARVFRPESARAAARHAAIAGREFLSADRESKEGNLKP